MDLPLPLELLGAIGVVVANGTTTEKEA